MGQSLRKHGRRRESEARGATEPQASPRLRDSQKSMSGTARRLYPQYAQIPMTREVLEEFSRALHRGFGVMKYGITGGAALAEYGLERNPSNIDVIVSSEVLDSAKAQLLQRKVGIVSLDSDRSRSECLGYAAYDGHCYALNIHSDRALSQVFCGSTDTIESRRTGAWVVKPVFLLNSKAWSYMNREKHTQKAKDGDDIDFILTYMTTEGSRASREQCRWVVEYQFWKEFTHDYPGREAKLTAIGLQRDPAPGNCTGQSPRSGAGRQSSGSSSTRSNPRSGTVRQRSNSRGR